MPHRSPDHRDQASPLGKGEQGRDAHRAASPGGGRRRRRDSGSPNHRRRDSRSPPRRRRDVSGSPDRRRKASISPEPRRQRDSRSPVRLSAPSSPQHRGRRRDEEVDEVAPHARQRGGGDERGLNDHGSRRADRRGVDEGHDRGGYREAEAGGRDRDDGWRDRPDSRRDDERQGGRGRPREEDAEGRARTSRRDGEDGAGVRPRGRDDYERGGGDGYSRGDGRGGDGYGPGVDRGGDEHRQGGGRDGNGYGQVGGRGGDDYRQGGGKDGSGYGRGGQGGDGYGRGGGRGGDGYGRGGDGYGRGGGRGGGDGGYGRGGGGKGGRGRPQQDSDMQGPPTGDGPGKGPPGPPPEQPNMGLSGKLAAEANKVAGVELKHVPPADAHRPDKDWRLYIFKGADMQDKPYHLHKMDHYLFGRDVKVVDVLCAHPSVSKQHAVMQFRQTDKADELGLNKTAIRPYLMDLGTVNGTFLNGDRLEAQRYYELLPKDVIKFGQSTREYVLLHEHSAAEGADD